MHLRRYLIEGLEHAFQHRIDGAFAAEMRANGYNGKTCAIAEPYLSRFG